VKLEGDNELFLALEAFCGEQHVVPAERTPDGRPGRRAALPCPSCDPTGTGPTWLTVALDKDGAPHHCYKRCSEDEIWQALGRDRTQRHHAVVLQKRTPVAVAVMTTDTARTSLRRGGDVLSESDVLPESDLRSETDVLSESRLGRNISAEDLSAWGRLRQPVEAFARYLGASVPLGRNFPCPLPNHSRHASFYEDPKTGVWKLRCWCSDDPLFLTVAEVRASIAYGHVKLLTSQRKSRRRPDDSDTASGNTEAAVWYLRAWHDAGLIAPLPIDLRATPIANCPGSRFSPQIRSPEFPTLDTA
jgi:hypothetical protein